MAASWERLRSAVQGNQFKIAASVLSHELQLTEPSELLQILQGIMSVVVETTVADGEDTTPAMRHVLAATVKGCGYRAVPILQEALAEVVKASSITQEDEEYMSPKVKEEESVKRWRRMMRSMFDADAAIAMLNEMLERYQSPEIMQSCSEISSYEKDTQAKVTAIQELNAEMVSIPIITRYGFPGTIEGVKEVADLVNGMGRTNMVVKGKNMEVNQKSP